MLMWPFLHGEHCNLYCLLSAIGGCQGCWPGCCMSDKNMTLALSPHAPSSISNSTSPSSTHTDSQPITYTYVLLSSPYQHNQHPTFYTSVTNVTAIPLQPPSEDFRRVAACYQHNPCFAAPTHPQISLMKSPPKSQCADTGTHILPHYSVCSVCLASPISQVSQSSYSDLTCQ